MKKILENWCKTTLTSPSARLRSKSLVFALCSWMRASIFASDSLVNGRKVGRSSSVWKTEHIYYYRLFEMYFFPKNKSYILVRYGTWILGLIYLDYINLDIIYIDTIQSWFYPGSLSQKRILVINSILFWVSEPG